MSESVFSDNLSLILQKHDALVDARNGLFYEAAVSLAKENRALYTPDDLGKFFSDTFPRIPLLSPEFALFCTQFSHLGCRVPQPFSDNYESSQAHGTLSLIGYIRNPLSDRAYRRFSSVVEKPSASYYTSFRDVCEEVYDGSCTYAILPIYTTDDGELSSFRKMISRYDLKILYETTIDADDYTATKFSLVSKSLRPSPERKTRNLLFTVVLPRTDSIVTFLHTVEMLNGKVASVSSHSDENTGEETVELCLTADKTVFTALYLFLESSHFRYSLVGDYINIQ